MSGYYRKAPLAYVVARIDTTETPPLTEDQYASLRQAMLECDLVNYQTSSGQSFKVNVDQVSGPNVSFGEDPRRCFLDSKRYNSFIVDTNRLEWRTSCYKDYQSFYASLIRVLNAFVNVTPVLSKIDIKQISLAYVDIVVPSKEEQLSDYFNNNVVLPLDSIPENENDLVRLGSLNFTKIVRNNLKIDVSIEQLPQRAMKQIPEMLMESDERFTMPFSSDSGLDPEAKESYALLTTQSSILVDQKITSINSGIGFEEVHDLTKEVFDSLLDLEHCKRAWEYIERTEA